MTVAELIVVLHAMPQDAPVIVVDGDYDEVEIIRAERVSLRKHRDLWSIVDGDGVSGVRLQF